MKLAQRPKNIPIGADDDKIVAEIRPGKFVPSRIKKREKKQTDDPAMARHPAFPNFENRKRLAQHFRLIKQDVSESASNHHAEKRSPGDKVATRSAGSSM